MKCDDCRVRSKALLVLRNVLSRLDANQISERECKLFSDFLQDLSVHAKDKECFNFQNATFIGSNEVLTMANVLTRLKLGEAISCKKSVRTYYW